MPQWTIWAVLGGGFALFFLIQIFSKSKSPFKSTLLSLSLGLLSLLAVNLTTQFTGVSLPVSTLSVCASAVGGIPAVTLMLILNMAI